MKGWYKHMNKRQAKKWRKKVKLFSSLECVLDKCACCENFECGDPSVGLLAGCVGDYLYDKDGNIDDEKNEMSIEFMNCKGYTCPYFCRSTSDYKKLKFNLPKSYKEYHKALRTQEDFYDMYLKEVESYEV